MKLKDILDSMIKNDASDFYVKTGGVLKGKIYLEIRTIVDHIFSDEEVGNIVSELLDDTRKELLEVNRGYDFSISYGNRWRFRIGIFYQKSKLSMVIRKIDLDILSFKDLNLPADTLEGFCHQKQGLILLTGITGCGKSTAVASMIEFINKNLGRHILTVEEPVEFIFSDDKSIINQRELNIDVHSYDDALKQFAIHSPDVIYIGNIRDRSTCQAALTAAETGVLVFSAVHSVDASSTIERVVNFFPSEQQNLVFNQLSSLLKGVISLKLLPQIGAKGLIPAYEIMTLSPTVSSLIRERKVWEIPKFIQTSEIHGMISFNQCLFNLVVEKKISPQTALDNSNNRQDLAVLLRKNELIK